LILYPSLLMSVYNFCSAHLQFPSLLLPTHKEMELTKQIQ